MQHEKCIKTVVQCPSGHAHVSEKLAWLDYKLYDMSEFERFLRCRPNVLDIIELQALRSPSREWRLHGVHKVRRVPEPWNTWRRLGGVRHLTDSNEVLLYVEFFGYIIEPAVCLHLYIVLTYSLRFSVQLFSQPNQHENIYCERIGSIINLNVVHEMINSFVWTPYIGNNENNETYVNHCGIMTNVKSSE